VIDRHMLVMGEMLIDDVRWARFMFLLRPKLFFYVAG
jgi:hypothetical protein